MVKVVKENQEMDDVVQTYCKVVAESTDELCIGCRIRHLCEPIDGDFENYPDVLKEAYQTVISTDDNMMCESCLHFDCEVDEYPCIDCKFNRVRSDPEYATTPCFWTDATLEHAKHEDVTEAPTPTNSVNHPSHYNQSGMECIDEMVLIFGKEATKHFCLLNAWKYRARAMYKNGQEDMDKANWYIKKYKELTLDEYPN